jgi:hypothetical protein
MRWFDRMDNAIEASSRRSALAAIGAISAVAIVGLAAAGFGTARADVAPSGKGSRMTTLQTTVLRSGGRPLASWQFLREGQAYLALLERDVAATRTTLVIGRLPASNGSAWAMLREISSDDTGIRAADGVVVDSHLHVVMEINRGDALQVTQTELEPLLDTRRPPPQFNEPRAIEPDAARAAGVQLSGAEQWNVADTLAPSSWLFSPRWIRGLRDAAVIVNAADGKALPIDARAAGSATAKPPAAALEQALPDAAEPQSMHWSGRVATVFSRSSGKPYRPYWTLARYAGRAAAPARQLWAVQDGAVASAVDLSKQFQLGAVTSYALAPGPEAQPWLFVLHGAPNELRVLRLGAAGWTAVASLALASTGGHHLSAGFSGRDWDLVWHEPGAKGHVVRHARWAGP